jgi:hypothetical protein
MTKWTRNAMCVLLSYAIFMAGCGGHAANPVDRYMPGDEKKSCPSLTGEIEAIKGEVVLKERQKTDRDIWNVVFFCTGFLVIVPWFFIDAKGSQEVEIDALKARKTNLMAICGEKGCSMADIVQTSMNTTPSSSDKVVAPYKPIVVDATTGDRVQARPAVAYEARSAANTTAEAAGLGLESEIDKQKVTQFKLAEAKFGSQGGQLTVPTVAELRQKFPQYDYLSDTVLAKSVYDRFYSLNMSEAEFNGKFLGTSKVK